MSVPLRPLQVRPLGMVAYEDGLALQEELRQAVTAGTLPDQLLLLEHPPVVTLGRNAGTGNLVLSPEALRARGIAFHRTGRGGDVTFHGPGQLVGYPVMDLGPDRRDVRRYVRDLEETLIRALADFGVLAGRIPGLTGVWIGDLKIAAIGVRISRWVTTHGFAFNVATDLDYFRVIVPCGIADRGVTSLSRVLRREVTVNEVRPAVARRFAEVFGRRIVADPLADPAASAAGAPLVVRGLPSEQASPLRRDGRPSPFPLFDGGQIGTTPRSRGHRDTEPRRPDWLKVRLQTGDGFRDVKRMLGGLHLNTVCQEARCPNIYECWADRTATFMILGDLCTRHCTFCAVQRAREGRPLDPDEPRHVAEAIEHLELAHAVITSVNRDELPDGGSRHFAETIRETRKRNPACRIEVLIPDFGGSADALRVILEADPDVLNHNTETVARLYPRVRPDASYPQSLELLRHAGRERDRRRNAGGRPLLTKSGLMVGLGETRSEILATLRDLRAAEVDIVTIGQYLSPSRKHLGVEKYYAPAEFDDLRREGLAMGFRFVESGPLVRSSYHARRHSDGAAASAPAPPR